MAVTGVAEHRQDGLPVDPILLAEVGESKGGRGDADHRIDVSDPAVFLHRTEDGENVTLQAGAIVRLVSALRKQSRAETHQAYADINEGISERGNVDEFGRELRGVADHPGIEPEGLAVIRFNIGVHRSVANRAGRTLALRTHIPDPFHSRCGTTVPVIIILITGDDNNKGTFMEGWRYRLIICEGVLSPIFIWGNLRYALSLRCATCWTRSGARRIAERGVRRPGPGSTRRGAKHGGGLWSARLAGCIASDGS